MLKFSDQQLTSIAQQFHDLSVVVGQFRLNRIHAGNPLNAPGIVQLLAVQWSLMSASSTFYVQAAQVTLADADRAAAQISDATKAANAAIKTIQLIDKVVSIGSAAGVLAAAVMTGDMNQIGAAAKGVFDAVKT